MNELTDTVYYIRHKTSMCDVLCVMSQSVIKHVENMHCSAIHYHIGDDGVCIIILFPRCRYTTNLYELALVLSGRTTTTATLDLFSM